MLTAMKRAAVIISAIAGGLAVLALVFFVSCLLITKDVRLESERLSLDRTYVRLFDREGDPIETEKRAVNADDLPEWTKNAFVAVEDKRFYSHHGFDYKRIGKAMMKNLLSFSFREGASTISQQLIKNTHLSGEKTLARKLREFKLTRALEKRYSKEQILELYLNSIYFGHEAFGIGDASLYYFGHGAEELTISESAMLAALVRSPNRYSPFRNAVACLSRRNFVLSLMKEQNFISEGQYSDALKEPLPLRPSGKGEAKSYLSLVFEELSERFPDAKTGELGSLKVYTFLDRSLQQELEKTESETDISLLVRSAETGEWKAAYSTCGFPKRSPASTLKPLLVYGPALEEDMICPATPLPDVRSDFGGYSPDDAGGATGTYMSARYALAHSVNIPAVRVLNSFGCEKAVGYLKKMGLDVPEEDTTLALALGGMKEGFSLLELANAYSTLSTGGTFCPAGAISRIEREDGKVLYRFQPQKRPVFSEETCFLLNDMLKTASREGTARRLAALPFPVCAKTGTAETDGKNTDAYTLAYTAEDIVAVWMGKEDRSPIQETGGGVPANHALRILNALYEKKAPHPFPSCETVLRAEYDVTEYEHAHKLVLADPLSPAVCRASELFKKSTLPRETCSRFTEPTIEIPQIYVKNGAVYIVLCQTQYYEYTVKRENRGKIATIYSGKFQNVICDNSVRAGEKYRYTVIPTYLDRTGNEVALPEICIAPKETVPDDWWLFTAQ